MSTNLELSKNQQLYLQIIDDLHKTWKPHKGQLEVGKQLISGKANTVFLQCGRKFGKTEFAVYNLWRHALLNPGSACYYVAPEFAQGKKLIWHDPRLLNFCDNKYVLKINNNECMIRFKNGSFIQVIGSENFAAANGLRPGFLVYDEFCEFNPRFHETMNPNRAVFNCPLLIIGTPPLSASRNKEQYIVYADECRKKKDSVWLRRTGYDNPHIDHEWFDQEKKALFARGEEYLWYSQYEAKLTAGGKHVIFPMLDRDKHVKSHNEIYQELRRDAHKLEWHLVADPGTTTVMGLLFVAVNPYTKQVHIVDEIYEKDMQKTSVQEIMPRILEKADFWNPKGDFDDDWYKTYDEAAAWFCNEVMQQYGHYFQPTLKVHNKKDSGISLIKDMLIHNVVIVSDKCENLLFEMENYVADSEGRFPKHNDHLIDCFRYFLAAASYSMIQVLEAARILGARRPGGKDPHSYQRNRLDDDLPTDWTGLYD